MEPKILDDKSRSSFLKVEPINEHYSCGVILYEFDTTSGVERKAISLYGDEVEKLLLWLLERKIKEEK